MTQTRQVVHRRDDVSVDHQAFAIGLRWLSSDGELGHAVDEAHTLNELTESLDRGDAVPALLGLETELEHHGERGVLGEGTLHPLGAVA